VSILPPEDTQATLNFNKIQQNKQNQQPQLIDKQYLKTHTQINTTGKAGQGKTKALKRSK